ncbi:PREDICTED: phosphoribosylformylglycinamidine synthase [Corvus brachyrhynchos]|uniref:phosphoribosylformylglycinamidine synthase n=1 Tax=Corvus brachyrhynchos TaxID=85066 RepID=UPI0008163A27|nr:PREDICTED: phosphoribosylformylglycinamidine synthase [Corvus brachyrhynchos]
MAAAFAMAGFQVWDVTTQDLCAGSASLDGFRGLVFVGGFSYADVLGSAKGEDLGFFTPKRTPKKPRTQKNPNSTKPPPKPHKKPQNLNPSRDFWGFSGSATLGSAKGEDLGPFTPKNRP